MSDIESWLREQGLDEYLDVFVAERIEVSDLVELTEADLRELGFPMGPRKRMLKSIASLARGSEPAVRVDDGTTGLDHGAASQHVDWSRRPDDRRPVTLLFADVCGSTAFTEQLDPEDAHAVLYGAVQRIGDAVEQHRGTVCRFMGDGLMAMFGVPTAFESHTHEACRAANAIHDAIGVYAQELERKHGHGLQVRVGLHAGQVVALEVGGSDGREWDASGPAVALAARMEQAAEPGTTLVTADTYQEVASNFSGTELPPVRVKGIRDPVPVVRLIGERESGSAAHTAEELPFVGRRAERAQLLATLDACVNDRCGRSLLVRGAPGIGKTRLVREIEGEAGQRGFSLYRAQVLDFGVGKGEAAVPTLVRQLLGLDTTPAIEDRIDALDRCCVDHELLDRDRAHLSDLLDLPQSRALSAQLESMSVETRLEERAALIARFLDSKAERAPCLVVVEDLHWANESTLHMLASTIRRAANCPVVFILTSRIAGNPLTTQWQARLQDAPLLAITLSPLRDAEARTATGAVDGLDKELVDACLRRAEGNPLFLLHLLRLARTAEASRLPTSVQTLVTATLDRLDPADRRAIQAAAVLGQRFPLPALRSMVEHPDYDCGPLIEAHLVRPDADGFMFTHALVMEGVLASLLREDRCALHLAAAGWFEGRDATLHAVHLDCAGDDRARAAYFAAAREQMHWNRFQTCIDLLSRGLELAAGDVDAGAMHCLLADAHYGLGNNQEAIDAYGCALESEADASRRCTIMIRLSAACRNVGTYEEGLEFLHRAEGEANAANLISERAEIHFRRANIHISQLDAARAEHDSRRAYEAGLKSGSAELRAVGLGARARYHVVFTGRFATVRALVEESLEICRREGLPHIEGQFINMAGVAAHALGEIPAALEYALRSIEMAPEAGDMRQATLASTFAARWYLELGLLEKSRELALEGLRLAEVTGERRYVPFANSTLGQLQALKGHPEAGCERVRQALESCTDADRQFGKPWLLGTMARLTDDRSMRQALLAEGDTILEGSVNMLSALDFRWAAIDACLATGEWEQAEQRHALLLGQLVEHEDVPLYSTISRTGRALARLGHASDTVGLHEELSAVLAELKRMGLTAAVRNMERALGE